MIDIVSGGYTCVLAPSRACRHRRSERQWLADINWAPAASQQCGRRFRLRCRQHCSHV